MENFLLLLMGNGYYCHSKNENSRGRRKEIKLRCPFIYIKVESMGGRRGLAKRPDMAKGRIIITIVLPTAAAAEAQHPGTLRKLKDSSKLKCEIWNNNIVTVN